MPHIDQFSESRYLKRADVGSGKLLTISECVQENVAKEGAKPEMKWVLHFADEEKGMVCNPTNAQLIAMVSGINNSDDWEGVKIVLYDDPSISFGGKLVGGIRVRAPKGSKPRPQAQPAQAQEEEEDHTGEGEKDSIPF